MQEDDFLELMHRMGFINRQSQDDLSEAKDIMSNLEHKISRKNLLVFLSVIQKMTMPWMLIEDEKTYQKLLDEKQKAIEEANKVTEPSKTEGSIEQLPTEEKKIDDEKVEAIDMEKLFTFGLVTAQGQFRVSP